MKNLKKIYHHKNMCAPVSVVFTLVYRHSSFNTYTLDEHEEIKTLLGIMWQKLPPKSKINKPNCESSVLVNEVDYCLWIDFYFVPFFVMFLNKSFLFNRWCTFPVAMFIKYLPYVTMRMCQIVHLFSINVHNQTIVTIQRKYKKHCQHCTMARNQCIYTICMANALEAG